ncbi:MAG: D-aminoacylase [Armatimonadota bacterium]|nr:D-aminoacylase [Armatimonadota bacterium]
MTLLLALAALSIAQQSNTRLIVDGLVLDGSGNPGKVQDIRIEKDRIVEIGDLRVREHETWIDAKGLVVAPGFIDAHSHTDNAMDKEPLLESQVRQGITTAIVGQDGSSALPISDFFARVRAARPTINFATFAGHGTIRRQVMGEAFKRNATDFEVEKMKGLLDAAMKRGALGLSTGLEYESGLPATPFEVLELAKVAAKFGGIYASHTRSDGGGSNLQSMEEFRFIAKEAKMPGQYSHIKLAVPDVWGQAGSVRKWFADARSAGVDITADVYPYTYWSSTITVLLSERNWETEAAWNATFDDLGGADKVILAHYSPNPAWDRKDFLQLAKETGRTPGNIAVEVVKKTHFAGSKETESIICKAMQEADLIEFLKDPHTMFCSDGSHGGAHPRGAGAFPRIFAVYVRELKVLPIEEAVRKATSLPAKRFGFRDRGEIRRGMIADIVVFDPARMRDRSTIEDSKAFAVGVEHVLVNGVLVLENERMTGARPGVALRSR